MKLEELQHHLFHILCEIDDACRREKIPYMLTGGTMLGAVRHHGFIPWDDDIDIFVWRKDYPAFKKALKKHLPDHLQVTEPSDLSPSFYDFICRVQDKRYFFHAPTEEDLYYENKQNFISVDIFFLDNSANSLAGTKGYAFLHKIIYGLAMGHRYRLDYSQYTFLQKMQAAFLANIGAHIPMESILRWHEKLSMVYWDKPGKYCMVTNDLPYNLGLPYEREWLLETIDMPFWGRMLPVPTGYDLKLKLQYGDYMKSPADRTLYKQHVDDAEVQYVEMRDIS